MKVQAFYGLTAGCSVSIARRQSVVKISCPQDDTFLALGQSPPRRLPPASVVSLPFQEVLSLPSNSASRAVRAVFTLRGDEQLSAEQLQLIRKGACYTVTLDEDDELSAQARQLRAVMFLVLKKVAQETTLPGFIDFEPPHRLQKDENLVAMLDLLGFSGIMTKLSLDEIEHRFTVGVLQMLWLVESISTGVAICDKRGNLAMPLAAATLEYGVISDTVVLYPRRNAEEPLVVLCQAVSLLMDWALQTDWLLRGAISLGSFRAVENRPIYLGSAILAAHTIEISQEWSGCVLGNEVVVRFSDAVDQLVRRGLLVHAKFRLRTRLRLPRPIWL